MPTQLIFYIQTKSSLMPSQFTKGRTGNSIQDAVFLYPKRFADGTTETLPLGDEKVYGFI
jgi:hypothetical protein